ncbi:MAG: hypothetical protein F6J94_28120 [Moorea sp. SIO1F2]|uniref:hypothetical protein n=1 Tax=unclassified Moorena TaxID=2683338 RepID=UPI0013BCA74A|nr:MULTISPECIES: hypothetical protein [unclassified Moorena]NEN95657.1 hypothetical protein [Moorena sp. SIO3I7]NEO09238.1 hypothetical protein [Moorena sp. SIO3I8]NEO20091.1 hypothetical protein [Moorena sp. SIO4A5]NEP26171.1 hypothetical protein [Moorena sp. SIO3I6]NEQ57210.1 hypothetical protein [Moorena sp. SIO4A1]
MKRCSAVLGVSPTRYCIKTLWEFLLPAPCSLFPVPCSLSYTSSQWGGDKIILSFSNAITGVNRIFFCNLSG